MTNSPSFEINFLGIHSVAPRPNKSSHVASISIPLEGGGFWNQLPTSDPELHLLKSKISYVSGDGWGCQHGGRLQNQLPTESNSAKISKIHFVNRGRGGEGGFYYVRHLVRIWGELQGSGTNFQILILSLNLLKYIKFPVSVKGGFQNQLPTSN